jgi:hypothetical protein
LPRSAAEDPFDGLAAIEPIGSLAALVEAIASALEREGPPDDLEQILDGVLRFGRREPDFERLTKAVRARSQKLVAAGRPGVASWFATLVVAWTDGVAPDAAEPRPILDGFLEARVREVAALAARDHATGLLALPTHEGGWIEPSVLVRRLAAIQESGDDVDDRPLDAVQALLRLLPRGREPALEAAATLRGEIGEAVRHALGGHAVVGPTPSLWAAAARARDPDADDTAVAAVHPDLGPDAALAGRYSVVLGQGRWTRRPAVAPGVRIAQPRVDVPTALIWRMPSYAAGTGDRRPLVDWNRWIWPGSRRGWFAASSAQILDNLDWWEARWSDRQLLEALFEPWTRLGTEGAMLLAVALGAKEPGERGLAVEGLAAALEERRVDPDDIVRALGDIARAFEDQPDTKYPVTVFRPRRLATSLDEVGHRSAALRGPAFRIGAGAAGLMLTIERPQPTPVGQLTPLLRLLVELRAQGADSTLPSGARAALTSLAARSSEAARLARLLVEERGTR